MLRNKLHTAALSPCLPQADDGWMEKLFPGVRAHSIPEQSAIGTFLEAIPAAVLLIGRANGKVGHRCQRLVDNGVVTHRRPHYLVSFVTQYIQQPLEVFALQDHLSLDLQGGHHSFDLILT